MRHASAGERLSSPAADRARPLDELGRKDASRLPAALAAYAIDRVVTSPHARCLETVEPIARPRALDIECREELAPDASRTDALKLLEGLPDSALVCTHREVIQGLFDLELSCEKGGVWVLERRDGEWGPVMYLPPPSSVVERSRARLVR